MRATSTHSKTQPGRGSGVYGVQSFTVQWLACLALVLLTYNPFDASYYHWIQGPAEELFLKMAVGLLLLFVYVFLVWVVISSIGVSGLLAGLLLWALSVDQILGLLPGDAPVLQRLVILACLATMLAIGLAWPTTITRLTGQIQKRYLLPKP